jgi:AcrR family transcriptional regulator
MTEESAGTTQWQERAVERSLKDARQRVITRGGMFIAAAVELLRTTGKADFTVQEVVDRAGLSLRSFYQHFATKDDLLLAVVEETVQQHLATVRQRVDAEHTPESKLEAYVSALFGSPETDDPASRGLVLFQWHLAASRTDEFAATIAPYVETVAAVLESGVADGTFRDDLAVPVMADLVTHTLVSILDMRVLGVNQRDRAVTADDLVRWCMAGVLAPSPGT